MPAMLARASRRAESEKTSRLWLFIIRLFG
jgi:hypothetical protein